MSAGLEMGSVLERPRLLSSIVSFQETAILPSPMLLWRKSAALLVLNSLYGTLRWHTWSLSLTSGDPSTTYCHCKYDTLTV